MPKAKQMKPSRAQAVFDLLRILASSSVLGKEDLQQMLAEYINADSYPGTNEKMQMLGQLTGGSQLSDTGTCPAQRQKNIRN